MIKIDSDKTIHLTRGDATNSINVLPVSIDNYTFQDGDTLSLVVFKKKGYTQTPVLTKTYEISESAESYNLTLTSTDTSKFELTNKKITYWYDLILNSNTTFVGFDEDSAKKFIVYPGGVLDE